jgi:general secretion pathway protein G
MVVVWSTILFLCGIALFASKGQQKKVRVDATIAKVRSIGQALDAYNMNIGHYPTIEEGGLRALLYRPDFADKDAISNWRGPYLTEEGRDGWGNKFNYQLANPGSPESQQTPYLLWSNGPDGKEGTDDDVRNWFDSQAAPR